MEGTENFYEQRLMYINKEQNAKRWCIYATNVSGLSGCYILQPEIWVRPSERVVTWERTYSHQHLLKNSGNTFWTFIVELVSFIIRWTVPLLRSSLAPIFVSVGISISSLQPAACQDQQSTPPSRIPLSQLWRIHGSTTLFGMQHWVKILENI
jgi:hypothetical protein